MPEKDKKQNSSFLEKPALAVDVVLFSRREESLFVLLHKRNKTPYLGAYALPGAALRTNEMLMDVAKRVLRDKAGLSEKESANLYREQLATFDALYRDPRGRTLSVTYLALAQKDLEPKQDVVWQDVAKLQTDSLPFDHYEMIQTGKKRLRGKMRYTNIASHLMPVTFRVDDLRLFYEAILEKKLNRSNFRSKLVKIGLIEKVEERVGEVTEKGGRPADTYRFASDAYREMEDFIWYVVCNFKFFLVREITLLFYSRYIQLPSFWLG